MMEPGATYDALDASNGAFHTSCIPQDAAGRIKYLDASKNQLLSLQEVSTKLQQLISLQQLVLARNRLSDVSGLELLLDLRVLNLARNKIHNLHPLEALTRLEDLDIHSNCISSLAPLSTLTGLVNLNAAANRLQDLPRLTNLAQLTELNLRHNLITQLTPAAAPPAATGAAGTAAGTDSRDAGVAGSSSLLPCSLQRLSLACNQLQNVSALTVLRQLPSLLDLCVDSNPFTAASRNKHPASTAAAASGSTGSGSGSSKGSWYREAVLLAACTPALLRLDGQTVLPAERALLLTTSASLHAARATQHNKGLSTVLSTQQLGTRPQSAPPVQAPAASAAAAGSQSTCATVASTSEAHAGDNQAEVATTNDDEAAAAAMLAAAGAAAMAAEQEAVLAQPPVQSVEDAAAQDRSPRRKQQEQQKTANHTTLHGKQQQQRRLSMTLQNQGSLKDAALTCGVDMPVDATARIFATAAAAGSKQQASGSRCPSAATAADDDGAENGAPDIQGVVISEADVDEYLQVEKARLTARTRSGPPATPPPATTPGMELLGSRCVLTGSVLHLLKGEALAGVTDLTLSHVAYAEVLDAMPSLLALRRLKALSLVSNTGFNTLPQLHPLLQLSKLCHLTIQDCPICSLVLLRPYIAFRFTALQSFNGTAFTADEVTAAGQLYGGLEATLDAALDHAPQQAALRAAGIHLSSSSKQRPMTAGPVEPNSDTAALLQRFSLSGTAAAAGHPDSTAAQSSSSSRVTQVLAAMRGPLLPLAAVMEQGQRFAKQVLSEAAVVQQQLAEFQEVTWPALIEASIHAAWSGHPSGVQL